jgi:hypothetical protein
VRFLAPLFLAGAALVAVPIVLHLLRRDVAEQVPFPAVRLLRATPLERSRNRRLRDLVLLAARVAALLLLAAAFGRPFRPGASGTAPLTIIAIDRSLSMSAPGRFQRAVDLARAEIEHAPGRVALIAFDDRAEVATSPGLASDARSALAALSPGAGGTRYAAVLDRAADLSDSAAAVRLVIVSDLQRAGFDAAPALLPAGIDLQVRDAGGTRSNLAVEALDVHGGHARVAVRNFGSLPASTTLSVGAPSHPSFTRTLEVGAGSSVDVDVDASAPGPVLASIADAAGYAADNERFAVARTRDLPRILVVTGGPGSTGGFYLTRALRAAGDRAPEIDVRPLTGPEFAALAPVDVAQAAGVVLLSTHAIPRHAGAAFRALFAAGGGVFVAAGPEVDASILSDLLGLEPALAVDEEQRHGVLAVSDVRHPVFRPFEGVSANLTQAAFEREWRIDAASWTTIATFTSGSAALLERAAGNGRVLLFASDVDRHWNDFPLHAAFVPFVQEAIRYVSARTQDGDSMLTGDVPDGIPARPGVVTIRGRLRAVNTDVRESAIDRMTPEEFAAAITRTSAHHAATEARRANEQEAAQGLWRYGLALMLMTLVVEAFVAAR